MRYGDIIIMSFQNKFKIPHSGDNNLVYYDISPEGDTEYIYLFS